MVPPYFQGAEPVLGLGLVLLGFGPGLGPKTSGSDLKLGQILTAKRNRTNRRPTDPTDGQLTVSTWCPPVSRVLLPFPALVRPLPSLWASLQGENLET